MSSAQMKPAERLPLDDMRRRVRDLLVPIIWLYWLDFLVNITLCWSAFAVTLSARLGSLVQVVAYIVCVLTLYRCVVFIHELAHRKPGSFETFRWVWNLTCGLAILLPSYTYSGVHNHHHQRTKYGTIADGEYYPFATRSPSEIAVFLAPGLLLPALLVLRFAILTPIGWCSARVREYLWEHASSMTLDAHFIRKASQRDDRHWRLQETLAFCYGASAIGLVAGGVLPWQTLVVWYLVVFGGLSLNALRTLVAHRYRNTLRVPMTISEQFQDSVEVPGQWIVTELWAPLGLRYHATHHLFPCIPYHNLGRAHRRLSRAFPGLYSQTTRRGLVDALRRLWSDAKASRHAPVQG